MRVIDIDGLIISSLKLMTHPSTLSTTEFVVEWWPTLKVRTPTGQKELNGDGFFPNHQLQYNFHPPSYFQLTTDAHGANA
jgi:hypothetical protein